MSELQLVKQRSKNKKLIPVGIQEMKKNIWLDSSGEEINSQHLLISMLLPPAVKAFFAELEGEVESLCGKRYSHGTALQRWGTQQGSIILGNQKIALNKPRVRDSKTKQEKDIETYTKFQDSKLFDAHVFQQGIKHVSQRDYSDGLNKIASSFGISKSSISRSWVKTTKKQIEKLLNRDLRELKIMAVFIDGKRFKKQGVVVALGVGEIGKKHVLGVYQSSTENSDACKNLLDDLEKRGLPERGLLFTVDGGSGLNKALEEKYQIEDPNNFKAIRVRCYKHKWENIKNCLEEKQQEEIKPLFWAIREAKDIKAVTTCSEQMEIKLKEYNISALKSYLEAKNDMLAIHKLGLNLKLRKFFSTTNPIESLNYLLEEDLRRVKRWRNSEQFHRWIATACLRNEKRMHRVEGYRNLPALAIHLHNLCNKEESETKNMFDNITTAA